MPASPPAGRRASSKTGPPVSDLAPRGSVVPKPRALPGAGAPAIRLALASARERTRQPHGRANALASRISASVSMNAGVSMRAGHRGTAADRSGRCVLDLGAARFRRQAAEVADQGDIDFALIPLLDDKADDKKDDAGADEAMTIALIKDALGDRVSDVRASQRLTSSASCLVAGGDAHDRMLERLLAMQNKAPATRPILEVNMRHPLVAAMRRRQGIGYGSVVPAAGAGADPRRRTAGRSGGVCQPAQRAGAARHREGIKCSDARTGFQGRPYLLEHDPENRGTSSP